MAEEKKPTIEYVNLSIMNLTKAADAQTAEIVKLEQQIGKLVEIITKCNWNFGTISKNLEVLAKK